MGAWQKAKEQGQELEQVWSYRWGYRSGLYENLWDTSCAAGEVRSRDIKEPLCFVKHSPGVEPNSRSARIIFPSF